MRLEAIGNRGFHSRLKPLASRLIRSARVARLATADKNGRPHVIPICFVFDEKALYSPIDEKPKRTSPLGLKRVRNIRENPHVAVVVDRYDENWKKLAYVLIQGRARLLTRGENYRKAVLLLRKKYPQYRRMALENRPTIHIRPTRVTSWGKLQGGTDSGKSRKIHDKHRLYRE